MAAKQQQPPQQQPAKQSAKPKATNQDLGGGEYLYFLAEDQQDRRNFWIGVAAAAVFHIVLLLIALPAQTELQNVEQEKPKVYVVQQVRFRPPPPPEQKEIPKPRTKKVPIPDPTPDEPEPIRLEDEIEPDITMPDTDLVFDIPAGPPPTEPTGPIRVGGDVKAPIKVESPPPQYTEIARKARIQGVVIVEAIIDKEGNVTNVKVLKGLPMGLDQAAVDAVKNWKFQPATLNSKPVAVIYNLTVNFTLQ